MPTPYDNHDGGFTRADYRIAADYNVDLDAPEQEKCYYCNVLCDPAEFDKRGVCGLCLADEKLEEALAFVSAPSMSGCLSLMGAK